LAAGDWSAIIRSGIFDAPTGYRFAVLTLTSPSWGRTHHVAKVGRPGGRRCPCGAHHDPERDAYLRGLPLDLDEWDYAGQVLWNHHVGRLWNRLLRDLRALSPGLAYAAVREWQARGSLHLHVLLRMPANEYLAPMTLEAVARTVGTTVDDGMGGRVRLTYGAQVKAEPLRADGSAAKTVWYLTKAVQYLVKDVSDGGGPTSAYGQAHWARLSAYARETLRCPRCPRSPNLRCPAPCHRQWGARSRVITVSDGRGGRAKSTRPRWSLTGLTRTSQRLARVAWAKANRASLPPNRFGFAVEARQMLREQSQDDGLAALAVALGLSPAAQPSF